MDANFWKKKWEVGETQFHQELPNPMLVEFFSDLKPGKVMVPLCGKSKDMLWLRSQGHQVVGAELSPIACEAFFKENEIKYQVQLSDHFTVYQGEGITLYSGDFFQVPSDAWKGVTALYDRAALIALPEALRPNYAKYICEMWSQTAAPNSVMLLETIEYGSPTLIGPPFSVAGSEVKALYQATFNIKNLRSQKDLGLSNRPGKFADITVKEEVWWLTFSR